MDAERKRWLEERQRGIGGSDSPVLLGVDPFRTLYDLWRSKVEPVEDDEAVESQDIKRGRALEPMVAEMWSQSTGYGITKPDAMVHPEIPWIVGNPDYMIDGHPSLEFMEIKCPRLKNFWKVKTYGPRASYLVQVQHYFLLTGCRRAALNVFHGDSWESLIWEVTRDEEIISEILKRGAEFWKYVEAKEPPPSAEPEPLLVKPKVEGGVKIIDTDEWGDAVTELGNAIELKGEADEYLDHARSKVITIMQDLGLKTAQGAGCRVTIRAGKKGNIIVRPHFMKNFGGEI